MKYPTLTELPTSRQMVDVFGGYNHNLRISDSEFYDMKNMTSTNFPVLSPRGKRGVLVANTALPGWEPDPRYDKNVNVSGIVANEYLCFTQDKNFVYGTDNRKYNWPIIEGYLEEDSPTKTLVNMGSSVIVFPDKVAINVHASGSVEEITALEKHFYGLVSIVTVGKTNSGFSVAVTDTPGAPTAVDGNLWYDKSTHPRVLRQWSSVSNSWEVVDSFVRISAEGIGSGLSVGDGVKISRFGKTDESGIIGESISGVMGDNEVFEVSDDSIVVKGIGHITNNTAFNIDRSIPNMDFVVEHNNRLWGCKYGRITDDNGNTQFVNEIYASKLGDFKNWNYFAGTSMDSYTASVGADGAFTGAIVHNGVPIFFKENCMIKVYGSMPSNFQLQAIPCDGIQKGCGGSAASVGEVLYYKSRKGVCAFDGSTPVNVSKNLGTENYSDAVAGSHGNKYYISMKDSKEEYHLFVYDTTNGLWHKEDNIQVDAFCSYKDELYYIDHADKKIKTMFGSWEKDTKPVEWMAETGVLTTDMPDKKYISRLTIRMALDIGTRVHIYAEYDSSRAWEHLFTMTGNNLRSFAIPIRPKRCDHLRLKFEGEGDAKIYSIAKTIEQGSDY